MAAAAVLFVWSRSSKSRGAWESRYPRLERHPRSDGRI